MGTDISLYIEKKDKETGRWVNTTSSSSREWIGRNYDAFAIMADVRNGYGFAGIPTSSGFNVIAQPKGFPEDVSDSVREGLEYDHSISYLTYAEIVNFDWKQTVRKQTCIHFKDWLIYRKVKAEVYPCDIEGINDCFGSMSAQHGRELSIRDAEEIVAWYGEENIQKYIDTEENKIEFDNNEYLLDKCSVRVFWDSTYEEQAWDTFEQIIEFMKLRSDEEDLSDVRCVFGFDC